MRVVMVVAVCKPYFLDAYLGVVGESVLSSHGQQGQGLGANDAVLALTFFVLVLVGTLASQVGRGRQAGSWVGGCVAVGW